MAAILDFCYNTGNVLKSDFWNHTVRATYGGAIWRMFPKIIFHRYSPGDASVVGVGEVLRALLSLSFLLHYMAKSVSVDDF